VRERLGLAVDPLQARVLSTGKRRGVLNCSRQWGKSTITAAKAVHQAQTEAGSLTLVVSPSARQSGEFLRKASAFVRMLKIGVKGDGDNEMSLAMPNGSRIVGLPGTEPTIRGFSAVSLLLVAVVPAGVLVRIRGLREQRLRAGPGGKGDHGVGGAADAGVGAKTRRMATDEHG
jgi:hypothetical protein